MDSHNDRTTYHICESEVKAEIPENVCDDQVPIMDMMLDLDDISDEMTAIRGEYCKYLD